jgi:GNAT superfamily N-acetyltransferase
MKIKENIEIREFRSEDMKRVTSLLQSVSIFQPNSENLEQLANLFLAGENSYACVASIEGCVVGFASVFLLQRIRGGCSAQIEDVVVDENYRNCGIGSRIVGELIEYARNKNCFKVALVTQESNTSFYGFLGFGVENRNMTLVF